MAAVDSIPAPRPVGALHVGLGALVALLLVTGAPAALAQETAAADKETAEATAEQAAPAESPAAASAAAKTEEPPRVYEVTTVTATLSEVDAFDVPMSVSVIEDVEERPVNTAADLLVSEPGIDVNGVGANQTRAIIRGQRGLRVMFLEDGLSLNNPRRQADFGEITGMVDLDQVETVELVRGPASVLYGSGAIGGVINLITKTPALGSGSSLRGSLLLRGSTADDQEKLAAGVAGYTGKFSYSLDYSRRDAEDYEAAAGDFGAVHLDDEATVFDTGVEDDFLAGVAGYQLSDRQALQFRGSRYRADQFGFGFVDPALLDPDFDGTQTRIFYPFQDFDRYTLSYSSAGWDSGPFGTLDVKLYQQSNERELAFDAFINIGPVFPRAPSSDIQIDTLNFTDLDTLGLRAEATRGIGERQLLTYGLDWIEDDSFNTDASQQITTFRFPFPPSVIGVIPGFTCVDFVPPFECVFTDSSDMANTPNAENTSYGAFFQDEIVASERLKLSAGARYQNVSTRAQHAPGLDAAGLDTAGLDFDDDALVGSLNLLWALSDDFELVGSAGTAFRAPSIIERLFNGLTPEGLGYQVLNPDLESETNEYFDAGFKFRRRNGYAEAAYFRNEIDDGIIQDFLSAEEIAQLPADVQEIIESSGVVFVVQQRNVDQISIDGVEVAGAYRFKSGVSLGGNYTYLDSERVDSDNPPTGDVAADKWNAFVRYDRSRFALEYRVRRNGEERVVLEPGDPVPVVGEFLPAFTVQSLNALYTVWDGPRAAHRLGLLVENLGDELYAEFSNIGSFRPASKRNFIATYRLQFK